jgi:hypothetical protein
MAAFGFGAKTLGVFFEKPADEKRTATPGWYQSAAFERAAQDAGLQAASLNGDAFSKDMKNRAVDLLKKSFGPVDLVVYSLAASLATFARALAALPDAAQGHFFFYGPHEPFQVVAGSDAVVVSSRWACPSEHRRNDGRCYEAGVAHECPVRDCAMGRLYGWDWRPPTRWEFCEAIGEQGRSAWVPVPADAPRTEPCEVGTEAVPLAHRFHRDGRP